MKCFVTGATGHIGNVLVRKLIDRGNDVTVLCLENENIDSLKDLDVNIVYGNITDRQAMFSYINKDDVVFHLAAAISIDDSKESYKRVYNVNVNGTKNIVDACINNKAKRLVYTSSVHIIEPVKDIVLTEPTEFDENKIYGIYSKTKTIATRYVMEKAKEGLLDAVTVYPAGVIGPFDFKISEIGQVILDYVNDKLKGYVKGGYNFIDVRDVADATINASINGVSGEGYILSGNITSVKEMLECFNEILHKKKLPPKFALWFLKMIAKITNAAYKARGKKPVFSEFSLYTLNANANFDNTKAKEVLGLKTRSVKDSFEDAIDWFINNKKALVNLKKVISHTPKKQICLQ